MTNKCREAFERWYKAVDEEQIETGHYTIPDTNRSFNTFQAAWQARGAMLDDPELVEIAISQAHEFDVDALGEENLRRLMTDVLTAIRERMG